MATFVVAHGAWSSAWAWKKMRPLMTGRGHHLVTPTLTGLGERAHLTHPDIDLETHIADVTAVLEYENLRDVILVGHSYGGMVATGVADRTGERLRALVYVDAFAPRDGECVVDLVPPEVRAQRQPVSTDGGVAWQIPPGPMPQDTPEEDRAWAEPRRRPQPLKTFTQKLTLRNGEPRVPRHYVYCARHSPDDRFRPFLLRARGEGWGATEIDASHNPHITAPEVLAAILDQIAKGSGPSARV